jgi:hypothetical protein
MSLNVNFGNDAPITRIAVAPAQAGAYRVCRPPHTHVMGTSLRWCDGVFLLNGLFRGMAHLSTELPTAPLRAQNC